MSHNRLGPSFHLGVKVRVTYEGLDCGFNPTALSRERWRTTQLSWSTRKPVLPRTQSLSGLLPEHRGYAAQLAIRLAQNILPKPHPHSYYPFHQLRPQGGGSSCEQPHKGKRDWVHLHACPFVLAYPCKGQSQSEPKCFTSLQDHKAVLPYVL